MLQLDEIGYATRRSNRLARLQRLRELKAPDIVIRAERALLVEARVLRFRPQDHRQFRVWRAAYIDGKK